MPQIDFKKDVLPHLLVLGIFLLLVFVFYHPVFLENKKIFQNDLLQWEGGAKELLDFREQNGREACGPIQCLGECQRTW